jgi:hypothetical protein
LGRSARADLIEIGQGGEVSRMSTGLTRGALLRAIYVREGLQLVEYLPRGLVARPAALLSVGVVIPRTLITLARLLLFVVWTEARAWFKAPRS